MVILRPEITGDTTAKDVRRLMELLEMQSRWNEEDLKGLSERIDAINERMDRIQKTRDVIRPGADLMRALETLSRDEIMTAHRQLFELGDRPENADLIYTDEEEKHMTAAGRVLDAVELYINRRVMQEVLKNE